MLKNINILAGTIPPETGNLREDYKALREYLSGLVRGLELCLDTLDTEVEKMKEERK